MQNNISDYVDETNCHARHECSLLLFGWLLFAFWFWYLFVCIRAWWSFLLVVRLAMTMVMSVIASLVMAMLIAPATISSSAPAHSFFVIRFRI